MHILDREWDVALSAVADACRLAVAVGEAMTGDHRADKEDRSPVTVADFGVQAVVHACLRAAFPGDAIVAEEDSGELLRAGNEALVQAVLAHVARIRPGLSQTDVLRLIDHGDHAGGATGRFWSLDPVDGTKGFLRGDQYAVALALIEDGRPVLGVLGCPRLDGGSIFAAAVGRGAFRLSGEGREARRVAVSKRRAPTEAVFCESFESGHSAHGVSARVTQALGTRATPRRLDSQAKYAVVATGDADVYLRLPTKKGYEEKIWDHAAGVVVVEQAGGRVTDTEGRPLDFSLGRTLSANRGVVATNGPFHEIVVSAVAAARAEA